MALTPTTAVIEKGLRLVHAFEGGHLAGNFDGQLLSWGPLQWNLGQGTLQPLLARIFALDPDGATAALGDDFALALRNDTLRDFVRARVLQGGGHNPRPEWRAAFAELGELPAAQQAFREHAGWYVGRATLDATRFRFYSERAWVLCFDTAVQNGGIRGNDHLRTYWSLLTHDDVEEWQHLKRLAHAISSHSKERWRDDVLSRKLTIAIRVGVVHGRRYDIFEDFRISHLTAWAQGPGA